MDYKRLTEAQDVAYDKRQGVKEGSKRDMKLDKAIKLPVNKLKMRADSRPKHLRGC
jgi:hypothetical protein